MRRDYFTLSVSNVDWVDGGGSPRLPTVEIDFRGPESTLRSRFTDSEGEVLDAADTDVAFRLQTAVDDEEASGVVAVTNRLTGDFILELNVDAEDVLEFITAARRYADATDGDARYRVEVAFGGDHFVTYEKSTFLVYNRDGDLMRSNSLIPSGVEL
ncbi:DUF5793 family protein [Halanaeroarchaeum sulfurireducens]|uniref:Uncharacterized protein n=1 Tax=Halanaeroarchaeum sulfurireducens TaxID=1604004 RepID=A0A0F7PEC4_9EURY|nr:DUF5793 family protein [Halanaeroarchaeum sulfurireducens]AKH97969.1 hypothetical protein HLASF_1490 [Halanaeroarchaeum sulfurireducens]ALG82363.1 hypothetical protein HLASA_1477 [Halanaeroarchaeum sulfurireducens]